MSVVYYPYGPLQIRDGTFDRLVLMGIFRSVYRSRTAPLMTDRDHDQLPNATVFNLGEDLEDPGAGAPSFIHRLKLAVVIVTAAVDEASLDQDICALTSHCMEMLLCDPSWVALSERVLQCSVDYAYPENTDEPLSKAVINIEVCYRSIWNPFSPNDFRSLAFTSRSDSDLPLYTKIELGRD